VLDSGHLSDGQGRKVNFRNTVIIMTANYGSEQLKTGRLGFAVDGPSSGPKDIRGIVEGEVKRRLLPEFLNRLDGTVVFEPLTEENLHAISRMLLARTAATATARSIVLTWDDAVLDWLSKRGYAARDGARPIRQLIRQHIEDGLVDGFYSDSRAGTRTVHVSVRDDALVLTTASEDTLPEGAAEELVVLPA
jgi:ATP-dependent Clp protease ATP-binding subunit ClpA